MATRAMPTKGMELNARCGVDLFKSETPQKKGEDSWGEAVTCLDSAPTEAKNASPKVAYIDFHLDAS